MDKLWPKAICRYAVPQKTVAADCFVVLLGLASIPRVILLAYPLMHNCSNLSFHKGLANLRKLCSVNIMQTHFPRIILQELPWILLNFHIFIYIYIHLYVFFVRGRQKQGPVGSCRIVLDRLGSSRCIAQLCRKMTRSNPSRRPWKRNLGNLGEIGVLFIFLRYDMVRPKK